MLCANGVGDVVVVLFTVDLLQLVLNDTYCRMRSSTRLTVGTWDVVLERVQHCLVNERTFERPDGRACVCLQDHLLLELGRLSNQTQ
jgi:hypothetical protein